MRAPSHAAVLAFLAGCSLLDDHVEDSAAETAQVSVTVLPAPSAPENEGTATGAEHPEANSENGPEAGAAAAEPEPDDESALSPVPEVQIDDLPAALDGLAALDTHTAPGDVLARPSAQPLPVHLHGADMASLQRLLPVPPCKRPAETEAAIIVRPAEPFDTTGYPFEGWDATLLLHIDGHQAYRECSALPLRRQGHSDAYRCFPLQGEAGKLLRRHFDQWGVHRGAALQDEPARAGSVELCVGDAMLQHWREQATSDLETMGFPLPSEGWDLRLEAGRARLADAL